jgi:hypothetical protein
MSPEERHKRAQYLQGLGVPQNYHDAIIDAPTTSMMRYGAPTLAFVLLALIIIVIVGAFFWLENYVAARAADEAAQIGATLIYVNVGRAAPDITKVQICDSSNGRCAAVGNWLGTNMLFAAPPSPLIR